MLEQRTLLLGPWQLTDSGPGLGAAWTQPVFAVPGGQRLGFIHHQLGIRWPLLRWLSRETLEVFETEDASLLCRVLRPCGLPWRWEVRDADERRVGLVSRRLVLDGIGRRLAVVCWSSGSASGRFFTPQGGQIGAFTRQADGTCLTFDPSLDNSPFARMALLGAVLVYELSLPQEG
jgi:hypothetical protein